MSIAQTYAECYRAFERLCKSSAQHSEQCHQVLLEEFDKYCLWAGNVGAAHSGDRYKFSLDYRLREASFYKAQVAKLLNIVRRQVEKAHLILIGERIPFEQLSSASESDNTRPSLPQSQLQGTDDDSPWEVSSDSSGDFRLNRNPQTEAIEETDTSPVPVTLTPNLCPRKITELQQLVESIRLGVTCLYKLPLRKPAPVDRLNDRSTEELSCYQHFDILYVRDKFPDTRLSDDVKVRLGKMITRRRQLLLYRKRHRDNLQTNIAPPSSLATSTANVGMEPAAEHEGKAAVLTNPARLSLSEVQSQGRSSGNTLRSKATTFQMGDMPPIDVKNLLAPSVALSDATRSITASEATRDIRIEIPPAPKKLGGGIIAHFECKYCHLTVHIRSDGAWKDHVMNDLQPYVCTYSHCDFPDHVFEDRDTWFNHEMEYHRIEFFCNTAGHPTYRIQAEFGKHMKEFHDIQLEDSSIVLDAFRRPSPSIKKASADDPSAKELCNLCYQPTRNIKRHVARHLQQIALFAIPRADFSVGNELLSEFGSDVPQNRSRNSAVQSVQDTTSQNSADRSVQSDFHEFTFGPPSKEHQYPAVDDDIVEQIELPSTEEIHWDRYTDKFLRARENKSELPPFASIFAEDANKSKIALMPGMPQRTDPDNQYSDLANLPIAHGATFDSYMDRHEAKCLPGTRTEVQRQIAEWAASPQGKCIFWLNGMAGTGKTTISRTIAKSFQEKKQLGASFFFRRGEADRGNASRFFPTITRQLGIKIPSLIPGIRKAIEEDPGVSSKSLREQFDKLILQPLLSLKESDHQGSTMVIVIDALDECENDNDIRVILQLLPYIQNSSSVRLQIFVTSRPELPIRLGFRDIGDDHQDLVLHEIPKPVIEHDLSLFLEHRIAQLRRDRSLPPDWPGHVNLQTLVAMSVPLFSFAATMCRVLENPSWEPEESLTDILRYQDKESKLAREYLPVLDRIIANYSERRKKKLIEEVQEVAGVIILLESPLSVISLSNLIGVATISINARLNSLHSVLDIPDDETMPVRLFHTSFRHFLLDPETCGKTFWVDKQKMHRRITIQCLKLMRHALRKNICNLPSYGTERIELDTRSICQYLPPELQYSCRYWAFHLAQCKDPLTELENAFVFLQVHFLHWVEAMSILGLVSDVVGTLNSLQSIIQDVYDSKIFEFLYDAKRFVLKNIQIVDIAPLQLYCSGLIFAPRKAIIKGNFESEIPSWLSRSPIVEKHWSPELQTLEGHSQPVTSVAFSPDGRLLASGSRDQTVKLWDAATGTLMHTLEGHSASVWSVVFSPDGRLLASGSDDKKVKLWDTATGALKQTLEGHSDSVWSAAFSPDGQLLASGSADETIKLWDAATVALKQSLEGHSDSVTSVAFSPDGRLLASGSDDKTVKLWDTATGALKQTLEGHSDSVTSVAFSPDGRLLASGSADKTVKLWDAATGTLMQTLNIEGIVTNIAFSKNDPYLTTNLGSFNINPWYNNPTPDLLETTVEVSLQGSWITIQSKKELWLPREYRPLCSAFQNGTLALGHGSGRVSLIAFCH